MTLQRGQMSPFASSFYEGSASFFISTLLALLGFSVGLEVIAPAESTTRNHIQHHTRLSLFPAELATTQPYSGIVDNGYSYNPSRRSNVAYFPALPAFAAILTYIFRVDASSATLIVSNTCLFGSFVLFYYY